MAAIRNTQLKSGYTLYKNTRHLYNNSPLLGFLISVPLPCIHLPAAPCLCMRRCSTADFLFRPLLTAVVHSPPSPAPAFRLPPALLLLLLLLLLLGAQPRPIGAAAANIAAAGGAGAAAGASAAAAAVAVAAVLIPPLRAAFLRLFSDSPSPAGAGGVSTWP